jgi:uncharacterized membrane protein
MSRGCCCALPPGKVLITFTIRLKSYCNNICRQNSGRSGGKHGGSSTRRDMVK